MKLKIFNFFRAAAVFVAAGVLAAAAVACSSSNDSEKASLTVKETSVVFDGEGGSSDLTVESTGVTWKASASESWLTLSPSNGTGNSYVTVTAAANETGSARTAYVTISAPGVDEVKISVFQQEKEGPAPVEFDCQSALFGYFGDAFGTNKQLATIGVYLFNKAFTSDGKIQVPFDQLFLVLNVPYADYQTAIQSVSGKEFKSSATNAAYTINLSESVFGTYVDNSGEAQNEKNVTKATFSLTVGNNTITIKYDVTFEDGSVLSGSYSGDEVYMQDMTDDEDTSSTTLEGDYSPVLTSAQVQFTGITGNDGAQITDCGAAIVQFTGTTAAGKTDVLAMLLYVDYADLTSKDLSGTYPVLPSTAETYAQALNTFGPGEVEPQKDNTVKLYPSLYYSINNNKLEGYAVPEDGTISFEKAGSQYKVTVALKDGAKHNISGTYTLNITEAKSTASVSSADAFAVKVASFRTAKFERKVSAANAVKLR